MLWDMKTSATNRNTGLLVGFIEPRDSLLQSPCVEEPSTAMLGSMNVWHRPVLPFRY